MVNQAPRLALKATLLLRVGISGVLAAAWAAIRPFLSGTLDQLSINPLFPVVYNQVGEAILGIWNRYDGYRYFLLAYSGYQDPNNIANTVFYPLYPMILRVIYKLTSLDIILISLVVSTITTFFAFLLLFKLASEYYGDETARMVVLCLAVYPTALFLIGPYTESLFLALTLSAFYLAKKDRWLLAGLAAALASLTRGPGVFTSLALAWVGLQNWRYSKFSWSRAMVKMAIGIAAPGLAGIGFLLWRQWMGFPPVSTILAQHFGVHMSDPITGLFNGIRMMFIHPTFTIVMEGITAIVWIALFAVMLKLYRRIPMEWLIYFGMNLLVVISKSTTIISPLQSLGRYVLVLFPGFIFLGDYLSHKSKRYQFIYFAISGTLLICFCGLYVIGFFIG